MLSRHTRGSNHQRTGQDGEENHDADIDRISRAVQSAIRMRINDIEYARWKDIEAKKKAIQMKSKGPGFEVSCCWRLLLLPIWHERRVYTCR